MGFSKAPDKDVLTDADKEDLHLYSKNYYMLHTYFIY